MSDISEGRYGGVGGVGGGVGGEGGVGGDGGGNGGGTYREQSVASYTGPMNVSAEQLQ